MITVARITAVTCLTVLSAAGCAQTPCPVEPMRIASPGAKIERVAWSPGGAAIAFVSDKQGDRTLRVKFLRKKVPLDLGPATAFDWSPNGDTIAVARPDGQVLLHDLHKQGKRSLCAGKSPEFARDGKSLAVVRDGRICAVALGNGNVRVLTDKGMMSVRLSADNGGWLFTGDGMLWRVNEDGRQKRVLKNSGMGTPGGGNLEYFVDLAANPDGKHVALVSTGAQDAGGAPSRLFLVERDGSNKLEIGPGRQPAWTPDSKRLLYAFKGDLWLYDVSAGVPRRLTQTSSAAHSWPAVSPDARCMAYSAVLHDTTGDGKIDWRDTPSLFVRKAP